MEKIEIKKIKLAFSVINLKKPTFRDFNVRFAATKGNSKTRLKPNAQRNVKHARLALLTKSHNNSSTRQ